MKNVCAISLLGLLSACNAPDSLISTVTSQTDSSSTNSQNVGSQITATSVTVQTMKQRYIYVLAAGMIKAVPIDSSTGELIQAVAGTWTVSAGAAGDFYSMTMNPNGKNLYVMMRNLSLTSKIYQYSVQDNAAYTQYGSNIPLTAMATVSTNVNPGIFSFGNNGNIFVQNFNYSPMRVDTHTINATTGALSAPTTVASNGATAISNYGLNFVRTTQVGYDDQTYTIDTQTNRVIHATGGVIQSSFDIGSQGTLIEIALH